MDVFFDWRWIIIKKICNDIWNKVSNSMKKEFNSEPIYNKKILKTKMKYNNDETTDCHDKENPKVGFNYTSLTVILINFILMKEENYYPFVFKKM